MQHNLNSCSIHLQDISSYFSNISDLNELFADGSPKYIYKCKS